MTSVSVNESLKKCPVCLDFFTSETTAKTNACDHEFCVNCIKKWSEHENCCPIDRKKFQKIFTISGSIKIKPKKRKRKNALYDVSVFCEVCKNSRSKRNVVILCDSCDLGYHCECLNPPLKSIPSGQWFCPVCREVTEKLKIKKKIAKGEKKQTKTDSTSLTISHKAANSVCAVEQINKKVKLSEENNVSCHFEKTVNLEEALSFEPEFEKLDSIFSSKKNSCINVAVNNENENLQNVFDMQSTNMPKLPDVHDAQQKESLLPSKGTDQNNIDCNKNLVNNFRIQEVHSAIKAKMNLPAELKKIEKEKWKAWSPKKKYKSSLSNLLNLGASSSQEHILTKRKNVCDLQNYQMHTIQNSHENDSEIKNILYNNLNPFSQLNNYSEPKKRFKAFEYNIIKSEGQAICYKPKDILCNTFCPSYLEHLEVREDGSLFLNWTKSDS
ncbi:PHD and RING finger domain-containing protein 1 [Caerostris darwini]|uniref:PHD and RING finger domain-containing protein 1 n=1 Tax=Caerostris darwini TaxID=1538125 RepID=A0AAV4SYE9_9ARAC|nr:PHD and RING finger domain-containing protein 1 [Caerostris darwini]